MKPSPCTLNRTAICSCGLGQMAWGPKMNFTLKNSNCLSNGCVLFLYSKPYILSKNISSGFIAFLLPLAPQTHTILRWNQRLFRLFFSLSPNLFIHSSSLFHPLRPSQRETLKPILPTRSSMDRLKTTCNFILNLGTWPLP